MNLRLVIAASLFAAVPVIASAQKDDPAADGPKPTVADAQKLVQTITCLSANNALQTHALPHPGFRLLRVAGHADRQTAVVLHRP